MAEQMDLGGTLAAEVREWQGLSKTNLTSLLCQ